MDNKYGLFLHHAVAQNDHMISSVGWQDYWSMLLTQQLLSQLLGSLAFKTHLNDSYFVMASMSDIKLHQNILIQ